MTPDYPTDTEIIKPTAPLGEPGAFGSPPPAPPAFGGSGSGSDAWADGDGDVGGGSSSTSLSCCCDADCDPNEFTCEPGVCSSLYCCKCWPTTLQANVRINACCGSFDGLVAISNGGPNECDYTGTFSVCGQTLTLSVNMNSCFVTIGGGCFATKSAASTCDCSGVQWTIEWSAFELQECPGC